MTATRNPEASRRGWSEVREHAAALAAVALLALAALPAPAAAPQGFDELLLTAVADPQAPTEPLRAELARRAPESASELISLAGERRLVVTAGERRIHLELREELVDALLAALAELPAAQRRRLLLDVASDPTSGTRRTAGLALLARAGDATDLLLALRLATPRERLREPEPEQVAACAEAFAACLARRAGAEPPIAQVYEEAHPALAAALLRALARVPSPEALGELGALLGRRPELDPYALSRCEAIASALPPLVADGLREPVRAQLRSPWADIRVAAARASGALEDAEAAPRLCDLVYEPEPGVREAARAALARIADRDLGEAPHVWAAWCERESDWWRDEAEAVAARAAQGPAAEAGPAIVELARHRLHRHEQALALARCLERPEPELVRLACEALGALRSPAAREALERAAADPLLRETALRSLRRIASAREGS